MSSDTSVSYVECLRVTIDRPVSATVSETKKRDHQPARTLLMIHGWPDDEQIWGAQVSHFVSKGYRCVRLTLPNFGTNVQKGLLWGESPGQTADRVVRCVQSIFKDDETFDLLTHDWGSIIGFELANKLPDRIRRFVSVDIGPASPKMQLGGIQAALRTMLTLIVLGLTYQWGLGLAFLLARCVPFVGPSLGNLLASALNKFLSRKKNAKIPCAKVTADCGYYYFYFQKDAWLWCFQNLFRASPPPPPTPPMPCFFIYGSKGFGKVFKKWYKKLEARGDGSKAEELKCGHWVQAEKAAEFNTTVEKFLLGS